MFRSLRVASAALTVVLVATLAGTAPAHAAGVPPVTASTPRDPLLGTTDLRSNGPNAHTLQALNAEAEGTGGASAVIALPMFFTPEALLGADQAAEQRAEISRRQDTLVRDLEKLGASSIRRYDILPYVAASLPDPAVAALPSLTSAGQVTVDQTAQITLAESTVRVQSVMAVGHGFSGAGKTVAIVDSGVDRNHPFLNSKIVSEACYSQGGNCPGGAQQLTGPGAGVPCTISAAKCTHGTHVAGIVAGRHTTGAPFDGVAPDASIISINVFSSCGTDCIGTNTSDMLSALSRVYALRGTYSIAAVNMSIGTTTTYSSACDTDPLKTGIDQLRAVGIPTVIASGNSSSSTGISNPGCISTAVTVGSTNDAPPVDEVSYFSNSNSFLDLLAPGTSIVSSVPGGSYASKDGTSMAAPHVAGAWALLKQQNPSLTVAGGEAQLQTTGLAVTDSGNGITKRRIRVLDALGITPQPGDVPGPPTEVVATPGPESVTITFTPPVSDVYAPTSYIVGRTDTSATSTTQATTLKLKLAADRDYSFTVKAVNAYGAGAASPPTSPVWPQPATVPGPPTNLTAEVPGLSAFLTWTDPAEDGGRDIYEYKLTASPGGLTQMAGSGYWGSPSGVYWSLPGGVTYTITVSARNNIGWGPPSAPSSPIRLPLPPSAPRNVTVAPGEGSAVISFDPPLDDGGSPVTWYIVFDEDPAGWGPMVGASASPITVTDLEPGETYTLTVVAYNANGQQAGPAGTAAPVVIPLTKAGPGGPTGTLHRSGYWMVGSDGAVYPFGDAKSYGQVQTASGVVDLEPTPSGNGYWIVSEFGWVAAFGDASSRGDVKLANLAPGERVTSLSATRSGNGYWIFTSRGRVLPFGDAPFLGDVSGLALAGPVLDSIPTPTGLGYYMVASDGGIFAFGDATFYGSMGGRKLNAPVQSLVPDADGVGYWLVAADGGIFAFQADFKGSMGSTKLNKPVTGMVWAGTGYLMVGEDGGIFDFSGTTDGFKGSLGANPPAKPIASVAVLADN